jgi:Mor family transcriptional regulator
MSDIITQIINTFRQHVSAITPELARDIEITVRNQWGGDRYYIARQSMLVDGKRALIKDELRAGFTIAQIEHKHGIPRTTIYRIINKKNEVTSWQD